MVALVDEWENVTDMRLTLDGYHRDNETKDVFKKRYAETRDGLLTDKALHCVGTRIHEQSVVRILRGRWEPFIAEALKNGCEAQARGTEQGIVLELTDKRTGVSMEVCEQDPEPGYHGATVTRFAKEIAEKEFQTVIREAGFTEEDINRYMVSTEALSPAEQKILAAADPQGRLEALTKQAERFLTHVDAEEILHTDQREKVISGLREILAPERANELRTISERYQQKLRDYQELNRTDPLLAYCRIAMPDCVRNGDMLVTHAADGTKVCIGEDMLPGGPVNSREGKRTYAMMVQCLNEFEQEASDQGSRDFAESEQTHDR